MSALTTAVFAQSGLSAVDQDALQKTLELLNDKKQREEAIQKDDKAQKADSFAKKVGGSKTDEIYAIAAKVFEKLVIKYNGDVDKMKEAIGKAQSDPESFANEEFSAEDLKAIKELSKSLPQPVSSK